MTLRGHDFETYGGFLNSDLVLKYVHDKFEGVRGVESLDALLEFALLHHFEVKDVVYCANKQIYLGYHY